MVLNKREIKDFYDKFGAKQDYQSFYENAALNALIKHGDFKGAKSVFEFGCGTGAFAKSLLDNDLPKTCEYTGIDLSETMVDLTLNRLAPFDSRAKVELSDGSLAFPFSDNSFDRFVSNYVLEILSDEEIAAVLLEAHRILKEDGLLCVTSLSCGEGLIGKPITRVWKSIHRIRPKLVGGCRPVNLIDLIDENVWEIKHHSKVSSFGVTSEVLVAKN